MFNSSPITSWDGAGVFYTYADGGAGLITILTAVLCILPLIVSLRSENAEEEKHG